MSTQPVRAIQPQQQYQVVNRFSPVAQRRGRLAVQLRQAQSSDRQQSPARSRSENLVRVPGATVNPLPQPTQPPSGPNRGAPGAAALPGELRQRPRTPWSGKAPGSGASNPKAEAKQPQQWNIGLTGRLLLDDLRRDLGFTRAEAERIVSLPVSKLQRAEVVKLSNKAVSSRTRARIVRELNRVAVALERRGDPETGAIARTMAEKLPRTVDAYAVKMLWDLTNRLPRAEDRQIEEAHFQAPEVSTTGENDLIREATFAFDHDGTNTSGYKFYFSSTPPSGAEFVADHELDVGYIHPSATGERKYHFEDATNMLNDDARYYMWATAYNEAGESGPSNVIHESFPSAQRGDLNRDGVIDTADMDALMRILLGEADAIALADVNADGWVTQADVEALIAKMS